MSHMCVFMSHMCVFMSHMCVILHLRRICFVTFGKGLMSHMCVLLSHMCVLMPHMCSISSLCVVRQNCVVTSCIWYYVTHVCPYVTHVCHFALTSNLFCHIWQRSYVTHVCPIVTYVCLNATHVWHFLFLCRVSKLCRHIVHMVLCHTCVSICHICVSFPLLSMYDRLRSQIRGVWLRKMFSNTY